MKPLERSQSRTKTDLVSVLIDATLSGPEVKFVHPVSPGGSVKFVASGEIR